MNNILYINPLHKELHFIIFDDTTTILHTLQKDLHTAETFPKMLVDLVDQYAINEIYCITGPGPFTLMRVITLAINALSYTRKIQMKSCHFFDLIAGDAIPLIEANPHEYLIRINMEDVIIRKDLLPEGKYEGIIGSLCSTDSIKYIEYRDVKDSLLSVFSNKMYELRIIPLYFKPPHITTGPKI